MSNGSSIGGGGGEVKCLWRGLCTIDGLAEFWDASKDFDPCTVEITLVV